MSRDPTEREKMVERVLCAFLRSGPSVPYMALLVSAQKAVAGILAEGDKAEEVRRANMARSAFAPSRPAAQVEPPLKREPVNEDELTERLKDWILEQSVRFKSIREFRFVGQDGTIWTWDVAYMSRVGVENIADAVLVEWKRDKERRDEPGPMPYYYVGSYASASDENPLGTFTVER